MTLDKSKSVAAMEVERFSKLGTSRLQQGFPDKALEAYKNAYQHAQTLSSHGYMLRACAFNLGAMLISTGNYIEGLSYLNKAIPPQGKRDGRSNGDLYFNYGLAYEGLKNANKSKYYYEMALKEFRAEHGNVKMEADTVSRISRLCLENNLLSDTNDWMKQLTILYSNLGNVEKELQSRVERSNLLLKMGKAQEAEEVADECFKILEDNAPSLAFAKMYSDLSVAYTQILHYDKAVQCSEKALPLVEDPNGDPRLASVIYQNLGAIYNYMGRYEEAVKYHDKACHTFAKLGMRANQGHCFTNMGYAYSQLKDMDKAGECFLHGLQAARDCGDRKTEWQNLEALASVSFNKKSLKKAEQYYQQAITVLSQSPETADPTVHERLVTKLKSVIQAQAPPPPAKPLSRIPSPTKELTNMVRRASTKAENIKYKDLESLATHMKSGDIKVVRKGSQVRYLKVRRSGTLQKFQKVALGLDTNFDGPLSENEDDDDSSSGSCGSSSDDSNDESNDETDTKHKSSSEKIEEENINRVRAQSARPPDSYLPRDPTRNPLISDSENNDGSVEQLEAGEEDYDSDDEAEVKRLMQQQLTGDDRMATKQVVTADVHDEPRDSDSSYTDESESEPDKRLKRPPVPDRSPETTAGPEKSLKTYETPQPLYHSVDHKSTSGGPRTGKDGGFEFNSGIFSKRPSDLDGLNYFYEEEQQRLRTSAASSSERPTTAAAAASALATGGVIASSSTHDDGNIYDSIRSQPQPSGSRKVSKTDRDSDGNELSDEDMDNMPRGKKEEMMYREFQSANRQREEENSDTGDQKNSKHCIVM